MNRASQTNEIAKKASEKLKLEKGNKVMKALEPIYKEIDKLAEKGKFLGHFKYNEVTNLETFREDIIQKLKTEGYGVEYLEGGHYRGRGDIIGLIIKW